MDEIKCEHCDGVMTTEQEVCPSCGKRQGVDAEPETREQLLETIARLERERDAALATTEDTKRLRGLLATLAEAVTEARFVGNHAADAELGWIYKARAVLVAAGYTVPHPVDEDHPRHAARLAAAAEAAGDAHLHQFWSTHAALPDGDRPAYMKITGELCERCDGFGGAPERIRHLARLLVQSEQAAADLSYRLEAAKQSHLELGKAAQTVAATNENQMAEITRLRALVQQQADQLAAREK